MNATTDQAPIGAAADHQRSPRFNERVERFERPSRTGASQRVGSFADGIARYRDDPSEQRVGSFADGIARHPSERRVGSFADGVASHPNNPHVGSFADGFEQLSSDRGRHAIAA
jgi:hypothetical protein